MKVALVCDWLTNVGGAEKVLLEFHRLYPEAPIYTSQYSEKGIDWFKDADVRTGWLQIFPAGMRRVLGPLRQRWFSRLDLSEYDLIISVTGAEAKAVKSGRRLHEEGKQSANPKGIHISYCHVPTQYYWQMYDSYIENPGFGVLNPLVRLCFRLVVGPMRKADFKAAQRPDYYLTISEYAKELIGKYYKREAEVVHPPVEINDFTIKSRKSQIKGKQGNAGGKLVENYYIVTSRQVNWKRLDLAIQACRKMRRRLLVIGEGPEHKKLVELSGGSELIEFLPLMDKTELVGHLMGAKGYLFPSLEPFGIAPVEALAAGCPVIAYGEGGARDYIQDGKNGVFFQEQTVRSLVQAMERFEGLKFDRAKVADSAEGFSVARFDKEIKAYVKEKCK